MKTKEEILKELEEVEKDIFFLNMIDRWSNSDYMLDTELKMKRWNLKKELEKFE